MKFTVSRATWYRGKDDGSRLLREDGQRCCIGFVCQQSGIADEKILGKPYANESYLNFQEIGLLPSWLQGPDGLKAYHTNDRVIGLRYESSGDTVESEEVREAKLKGIFARNGDEIEFVD